MHAAAQLSQRPGSVWNRLWGNALKRSPGIIRKSRVSYPNPRFLSSATWLSLPKKHYNGLNQTKDTGPRFTKNLKSDSIRKHIAGTKMRFTKNHNLKNTSVFERDLTLKVARCSRNYSLLAYNGTGGVSGRG